MIYKIKFKLTNELNGDVLYSDGCAVSNFFAHGNASDIQDDLVRDYCDCEDQCSRCIDWKTEYSINGGEYVKY